MRLFAAVFACLLFCVPVVWAADNCQDFRAISRLDYGQNGYEGPVIAVLGTDTLIGRGSTLFYDTQPQSKCVGGICQDKKARFTFSFGDAGSFVVESDNAVYDAPPFNSPNPVFGYYRNTGKIVNGTKNFEKATGNLSEGGPFVAWWVGPMENLANLLSSYNGVVTGKICGVKPLTK